MMHFIIHPDYLDQTPTLWARELYLVLHYPRFLIRLMTTVCLEILAGQPVSRPKNVHAISITVVTNNSSLINFDVKKKYKYILMNTTD